MSNEPLRPTVVETVFYEPDRREVIAVLPGGLWLTPGDIVELDDPARDARVLSTRLQLRRDEARVLIVLDVADDALRGDAPSDVALAGAIGELLPADDALDDELERLTDEAASEAAADEG